MGDPVYVEVLETADDRQIAPKTKVTVLIDDRRADIEASIRKATEIAIVAAQSQSEDRGWGISELEFTFGVKLGADAGVIVSRLSAEASLEVTVRVAKSKA